MNLTVAEYRELIRSEGSALLAQLERIKQDDWSRPSPCEGWDLLNVVVHMQLGTMVHTRMVENALAGKLETPWAVPEGIDARTYFQQVHRETYDRGAPYNLAQLRERLPGYDAALAHATDDDLAKPAWFYGLPDTTLRNPISAFANDLIVHASDIRRPLGLEPWFSPAGSRYAGAFSHAILPLLTTADRLAGLSGTVQQTVDGVTTIATLSSAGLSIAPAAPLPHSGPEGGMGGDGTPDASIDTDGGTWVLLTWRSFPPAEAERLGRVQIGGDRALVERYLAAIKTP
ncbi:MAG: maleylpyruvate isomerase family mycothiol-dependent enzyme [Chloroflexota bacterium]